MLLLLLLLFTYSWTAKMHNIPGEKRLWDTILYETRNISSRTIPCRKFSVKIFCFRLSGESDILPHSLVCWFFHSHLFKHATVRLPGTIHSKTALFAGRWGGYPFVVVWMYCCPCACMYVCRFLFSFGPKQRGQDFDHNENFAQPTVCCCYLLGIVTIVRGNVLILCVHRISTVAPPHNVQYTYFQIRQKG